MKVLGLSFGRKNGNCDTMVKEALLGAREIGAEINFLSTVGKKIGPCIACFGCSKNRRAGGDGTCILKDDMHIIEEAILDADAVIIAAPVYSVGTTGQYKCLVDRMGYSHDRVFADMTRNKIIEAGGDPDLVLDARGFKDRFLGLISVGGATEKSWTALGLPTMSLFSFSMQMPVIDHLNVFDMNIRVNLVLDDELMNRVNQLGRNVASAIGTPKYEALWKGDKPGICPGCHNDLLSIKSGTTVECPVCGLKGQLAVIDGQIKVDFPKNELEHSRMRYEGLQDHVLELCSIESRIPEHTKSRVPLIPEKLKRYDGIPVL